jgi:hypothetical protein
VFEKKSKYLMKSQKDNNNEIRLLSRKTKKISYNRSNLCDSDIIRANQIDASWSVDQIKYVDTSFSVTQIKQNLNSRSSEIISKFNNKIKEMSDEMKFTSAIKGYGTLLNMVGNLKENLKKINEKTDNVTVANIMRNKGYNESNGSWSKSFNNGVDKPKEFSVRDYGYYNVPDNYFQFEIIPGINDLRKYTPEEAQIMVKLESENLREDMNQILPDYKQYIKKNDLGGNIIPENESAGSDKNRIFKDSIYYHIGKAPEIDNSKMNDVTESVDSVYKISKDKGYGEMSRIVAELTVAEVQGARFSGKYESKYLSSYQISPGFSAMSLLSICTGITSSVGGMIGSIAAAGLGTGVAIGIGALSAGLTTMMNTGLGAMTTYINTIGMDPNDPEQKKKINQAWGNWGISALTGAVKGGISVAGAAIGGAVTSGIGSASGMLGNFMGSFSSGAFTGLMNMGIDMGAAGLRYAISDRNGEDWGQMRNSLITSGVTGGIGLATSAITSAVSARYGGSHPYLTAGFNWGMRALGNEGSYLASNAIIGGINANGNAGAFNDYMMNAASSRYGNASYWTGQAADLAGTMASTAATSAYSRYVGEKYNITDQYELSARAAFGTSMISQGISRGFGLIGSAIGGGIDGGIS